MEGNQILGMDNIKHYKHANLERRSVDGYASNEIAILGSNCTTITELVKNIADRIGQFAKIAYLDASHSEGLSPPKYDSYTSHHSGQMVNETAHTLNPYSERIFFSQYDLLLINGNHFKGAKQILILDPAKEASVKKRLDQLDRVQFVVYLSESPAYFDFLTDTYPNIKNLKAYAIDQLDAIANHVKNLVEQQIAPVKGLVLAGGKSKRMGQDKTQLKYHGKTQLEHTVGLLEENQLDTFVSLATDQQLEGYQSIADKFLDLGVFGAICSAFMQNPNTAWLVLATDLPFVDSQLIDQLLKARDPSKVATAVKGQSKEFVEPLITIYEPKAYPVLLSYLAQGYSCPRKALINSDVTIVEVADDLIRNINTPQEYKEAQDEIAKQL